MEFHITNKYNAELGHPPKTGGNDVFADSGTNSLRENLDLVQEFTGEPVNHFAKAGFKKWSVLIPYAFTEFIHLLF